MEPEYVKKKLKELKKRIINKNLKKILREKLENDKINKYNFYYYPKKFKIEIPRLKKDLETFFLQNIFLNKIDFINILLVKEKNDRR
jgi:hypothetical protein